MQPTLKSASRTSKIKAVYNYICMQLNFAYLPTHSGRKNNFKGFFEMQQPYYFELQETYKFL